VDTQLGGEGCSTSLRAGLGSHAALEAIVFPCFYELGRIFGQHLSNSRQVAETLELELALVNHAFCAQHYLEFTTGRQSE
jgi:hypothetical protein